MTFTRNSSHPLSCIYERLRKKSYRRQQRSIDATWRWVDRAVEEGFDIPFEDDVWTDLEHRAYVQGVRDALAQVNGDAYVKSVIRYHPELMSA